MHTSKKQIIVSGLLSIFLVTTLVITSTLINNPNFSLDIRNYAANLEDEEMAFIKKASKPAAKPAAPKPASQPAAPKPRKPNDLEEEQAYIEKANVKPTATLTPTPTPTPAPTTTTTTHTSRDEDMDGRSLNTTTTVTNTTTTNPTTGQTVQTTTIADVSANNPTVSQNATIVKTTNADKTTKTDIQSTTSTTTKDKDSENGFITNTTTITRDNETGAIVADKTKTVSQDNIDRITALYPDKNCGGLKAGESCVPIQGTGQYGITQNSQATSISYNSGVTAGQPTSVPVVTNSQESQSFWQQLGNKFNDASNDTGLVGMGTGGLGMDGNTTAIPLSVITSDDPEAVNNYLVGSTIAVAAGAGAAALTVGAVAAAPVVASSVASTGTAIYTLAGGTMTTGTLATIPTAALAYGSAAISTTVAALPAAVQTGLAVAGTTAAIVGPGAGMYQCTQSGDPGSPACVGMVTGYMSNPLEVEYALSDSINAVKSITTNNLYDFYDVSGVDAIKRYEQEYGKIPKQIDIVKQYNDYYPFQNTIIDNVAGGSIDNTTLKSSLLELKSGGVNVHIMTPEELESQFGAGTGGACKIGTCGGIFGIGSTRTADIYVTDPKGYASLYETNIEEGALIMAQKIGHEGGHAKDWLDLGLGEGDVWATEFRQKAFNMKFYETIGEEQTASGYRDFLNLVIENSTVHVGR